MGLEQELSEIKRVIKESDWSNDRASILLPQQDITDIDALAQNYRDVEAMVIIGIGGSNLGTWAIHEALNGEYHNESEDIKVYFADTPDAHTLTELQKRLVTITGRILYVVISKSGSTAETIANASILVDDWQDAVVITGKNSSLDGHKDAATLYIPENVGGRYSVFSPVGLFPLAVLGVDIQALLKGAAAAREQVHAIANQAKTEYEAQKPITELFTFAPLARLGQWRRQLIAESLGKKGKGPMPTTRVGTTDLHSTAQRSLDGPNDTYTTFVFVQQHPEIRIPQNDTSQLVDDLANNTTQQLFEAVQQGVLQAYKENNREHTVITIETINEYTLGSLMQTWMLQTMIQASLLEINAFNQPAVEDYKKHTKTYLSK